MPNQQEHQRWQFDRPQNLCHPLRVYLLIYAVHLSIRCTHFGYISPFYRSSYRRPCLAILLHHVHPGRANANSLTRWPENKKLCFSQSKLCATNCELCRLKNLNSVVNYGCYVAQVLKNNATFSLSAAQDGIWVPREKKKRRNVHVRAKRALGSIWYSPLVSRTISRDEIRTVISVRGCAKLNVIEVYGHTKPVQQSLQEKCVVW